MNPTLLHTVERPEHSVAVQEPDAPGLEKFDKRFCNIPLGPLVE